MDATDWAQLGMLANDIFVTDYVLTHPGSQIPEPPSTGTIRVPGVSGTFNTNLLVLGVLAVVAVVLLNR